MTKKWMVINLLLLAAAGLLGWGLRASINQFRAENDPAAIQPAHDVKQAALQEKSPLSLPPAPRNNYHPAEFAIIPERTLFSESRSKDDRADVASVPEVPQLTPRPILVGITITDNHHSALIIDPAAAAQARGRRAELKRIGDYYQGYTITGIAPDHIVLESGTRREIIPLHEGSKQAQTGKTPILSTRVVSFGGGGVSGGTPIAGGGAAGTPAGGAETARIQAQQPAGMTITVPPEIIAAGGRGRQATVQPAPDEVERTPPAAQPPPGGARIIRTPFGDIVRP
ncbi:MAG TPA: hypothetical protein VLL97_08125 [Acidobacteriota bacterium]|nr:hypothetical protein [Acidobacteriota bacterium]